jgi:hypothetical protein
MPDKYSSGERLVRAFAIVIFLFVATEAVGANWCKGNYPHSYDTNSYHNEDYCAAHGDIWFIKTVHYIVHENREDLVASGTMILAIFTIVLALAARQQAILTRDAVEATIVTAKTAERSLSELERAYVFPSVTDIQGPNNFGFRIRLRSLGRTPAIVKEVAIKFNGNIPLAGKPDLSGQIVTQDFDWAINDTEWTDFFNSPCTGEQHFFGFVRYLDIFNKEHRSWFGIYIDATGRAFRAGGDEYNSWD